MRVERHQEHSGTCSSSSTWSVPSTPPTPTDDPETVAALVLPALSLAALEATADTCTEMLDSYGVAVLRGVVPPESCDAARAVLVERRADADQRIASGEPEDKFFRQRFPCRVDMMLRLGLPALDSVFQRLFQKLATALQRSLGEGTMVLELAAHISKHGALAQEFHCDHEWTPRRQVVTCFAAMQDTPLELGPTEVLLGSHVRAVHAHAERGSACLGDGSECLGVPCPTPLTLQKGDVALMDARVVHRGGGRLRAASPRTEAQDRILLYFTVQQDGTFYGETHLPSLLPEYRNRLQLNAWETWLETGPPANEVPPFRVLLWQDACRVRGAEQMDL